MIRYETVADIVAYLRFQEWQITQNVRLHELKQYGHRDVAQINVVYPGAIAEWC